MLHGAILKAARGTKNLLSFLVFHFGFFPSVSMEMEWGEKRTNKNLIGKLLGKGPDFLNMGWIMRTWRPRKGVRVTVLGNNFYLFSFDLEEDFLRAWARGTVFMGKQCLVVRRWHPKLEGDDRNMCCAQVWIRLSGLHYQELLSSKIISEIASELGQAIAIAIDSSDGEVSMCVEVDVNQPLVMEVMVEDGMGGGVWQSLQYEIPMLFSTVEEWIIRRKSAWIMIHVEMVIMDTDLIIWLPWSMQGNRFSRLSGTWVGAGLVLDG